MLVPFILSALSVGFCFFGKGTLGAFLPDLPGDPVNDFLNLFDKKYQNKKVYKFSINKSLVDKIKTKLKRN